MIRPLAVLFLILTMLLSGCGAVAEQADTVISVENKVVDTEPSQTAEPSSASLPPYEYAGDDPYLPAVCAYLVNSEHMEGGVVVIPNPVILEVDDSDPQDIRIWGNFWTFAYRLQNTTLITESGGERSGLMHLKQTEDGYAVTSMETLGDGDLYAQDAKRIFGWMDGLLDRFYSSKDQLETVRVQYIREYVLQNGLNVDQYQDFGWPPVPLDGQPTGDQIVHYESPMGYAIDYDLREFSFSSYDDNQEGLSGVGDLHGISILIERFENTDIESIIQTLESSMEQPEREETAIGADWLEATLIRDLALEDDVIIHSYVLPTDGGGALVITVRNTYYAVAGNPVVPGADPVLEKTLQTFYLR